MYFFEKAKGLAILMFFFITSLANASLSFEVYEGKNALFSANNSNSSEKYSQNQKEKRFLTGLYVYQLNGNKSEFNRLLVSCDIQKGSTFPTKSLPDGPKSLLMVIVSFVCISIVRDKKFWIHALIGLLSAGQTGLNILPNVVSRLSTDKKNEEIFSFDYDRYYRLDNNIHSPGNLEDTIYIGLLRFLAGIPKSAISFPLSPYLLDNFNSREKSDNSYVYAYRNSTKGESSITTKRTVVIILESLFEHSIQYEQYYFLIPINDRYFYFSESFDFVQLARGPPLI